LQEQISSLLSFFSIAFPFAAFSHFDRQTLL
jgi:hypothetical protein